MKVLHKEGVVFFGGKKPVVMRRVWIWRSLCRWAKCFCSKSSKLCILSTAPSPPASPSSRHIGDVTPTYAGPLGHLKLGRSQSY